MALSFYKRITVDGKVVLQHRFLVEQLLGRSLSTHEHVHHKDKNYLNNAIENLEVLSSSEHTKLHKAEKPAAMVELCCAYCSTSIFRRRNQVVTKIKNGQTDFYCNRSCAAKHFGRGRSKH